MFHARMLLNHLPLYSCASTSKLTMISSPALMANWSIRSAPNISKTIFFGYWSWVSITYCCDFHGPRAEVPSRGSITTITLPCSSMLYILQLLLINLFLSILYTKVATCRHTIVCASMNHWHYICEITKIVLKTETFSSKFCLSHSFFVFLYDEEASLRIMRQTLLSYLVR